MKLSIEATDKLENKDFHYELTVSQTHIAIWSVVLCQLISHDCMDEEKIKKKRSIVTRKMTELLQALVRLVYIQEYLLVDNLTPYEDGIRVVAGLPWPCLS